MGKRWRQPVFPRRSGLLRPAPSELLSSSFCGPFWQTEDTLMILKVRQSWLCPRADGRGHALAESALKKMARIACYI